MKNAVKKPSRLYEGTYRGLRQRNIDSWMGDDSNHKTIRASTKRILGLILAEPWAPKTGSVIELGCGTAPLLRWVHKRGFETGLGVDVSKTAIAMAREQSDGLNLRFKQADVCGSPFARAGSFDLAIDGECLHCLVETEDRRQYLENARRLLRKNGLLVILTMCSPVDRKALKQRTQGRHRMSGDIIYVPYDDAMEYVGGRLINGQPHLPTRRVPHWRNIPREVRQAGFTVQSFYFVHHTPESICSGLVIAAISE